MIILESIVNYFLPLRLRQTYFPDYQQVRTVVTGLLVAVVSSALLTVPLALLVPVALAYYIITIACLFSLYYIRFTGNVVKGALASITVTYMVMLYVILNTGGIFSLHVASLYLLLVTGYWLSRRVGNWMTLIHLSFLYLIYLNTEVNVSNTLTYVSDDRTYTLLYKTIVCLFLAVYFSLTRRAHDTAEQLLRNKQLLKIESMNKLVNKKSEEIEKIRANIARDFHDETGNILSAIIYQANRLRLMVDDDNDLTRVIDQLNFNCEALLASSRDFLWSLNHESNNPMVVFEHLTSFGQHFFNQYDISFFANPLGDDFRDILRIESHASRNLILIFKEAMTNAAKHSGATHVKLEAHRKGNNIRMVLKDNGVWKPVDPGETHYGLVNMESRCKMNNLKFKKESSELGTSIEVEVAVKVKIEDTQK